MRRVDRLEAVARLTLQSADCAGNWSKMTLVAEGFSKVFGRMDIALPGSWGPWTRRKQAFGGIRITRLHERAREYGCACASYVDRLDCTWLPEACWFESRGQYGGSGKVEFACLTSFNPPTTRSRYQLLRHSVSGFGRDLSRNACANVASAMRPTIGHTADARTILKAALPPVAGRRLE